MTPGEAADVLAVAAVYDRRDITQPEINAWAASLSHGGVTYQEAMVAVPMHYADTRDWIMPADIIRITGDIREEERRERARAEAEERQARHVLPPEMRPDPSPVRDRREDLQHLMAAYSAERGVVGPGEATDADGAPRPLLRDDPERLHALIESHRIRPDGTERWSATGDPGMRSRQARWHPELAEARHAAAREKARAILAESGSSYARARRGEPVPAEEASGGDRTDRVE